MISFRPVTIGINEDFEPIATQKQITDTDPYRLNRRFGSKFKKSKLKMDYVCRPMDMMVSEAQDIMQKTCEELSLSELTKLLPGTNIMYIRRDTGKLIRNVTVIKQASRSDGNGLCALVGIENSGGYYSQSRRSKIAQGANLPPSRFTNMTWTISSATVVRLFRVKSEIDILKELVGDQKKQIDRQKAALERMKEIMLEKFKE